MHFSILVPVEVGCEEENQAETEAIKQMIALITKKIKKHFTLLNLRRVEIMW